ncbi:MAG: 30S ribosomal protein S12 methylthiotransferase RimO [Defluviitaleaceae bacterium]|nr:30S ribosomal protein S12 methylthiotransferase RimO [Defluviitaleaceae bacterium]
MLGLINREGYELTNKDEADVLIINTCGFIMDATSEGIEQILELAKRKKEGKAKGLIVTGCMAQRYQSEIFKELPEVDAVIGTTQFQKINHAIRRVMAGESNNISYLADRNTPTPDDYYLLRKHDGKHFAYLKISEGCDRNCTYCTIPSIRGRHRSRSIESLVEEATILASQGVRELIIVAQDTTHYGTDLYGENRLHILLRELSKVDGIHWMRMLYAYPEHITEETIKEMARNPKVLPYLDMPIQHSHDFILKRMGRGVNNARLVEIINHLRKSIPGLVLRTTVIVGFPGETEEHFEQLLDFIREMKFDRLGVFAYSREEGTPADRLPNHIEDHIKQNRKNLVMQTQQEVSESNLRNRIGTTLEAIVEKNTNGHYAARTYMDCYEIDGFVFFDSEEKYNEGDFVNIRITHSLEHDLIGEVV